MPGGTRVAQRNENAMRTTAAPLPTAPVVLRDVADLAEADFDALLAEELPVLDVDALARSVVRSGGQAFVAHDLGARAETLV